MTSPMLCSQLLAMESSSLSLSSAVSVVMVGVVCVVSCFAGELLEARGKEKSTPVAEKQERFKLI